MDRETIEILGIAVVASVFAHAASRRYGRACLAAALAAPVVYVIESALRLQLPPAKIAWLPMIFPILMLCSGAVAALTGLPFLLIRKHRRQTRHREPVAR